jgi:hypothetical protein
LHLFKNPLYALLHLGFQSSTNRLATCQQITPSPLPPSLSLSLSLNIIRVGGVVVGRRRGREIIGYSKV